MAKAYELGDNQTEFSEKNIQKYFNRYSLFFDKEHNEYAINLSGFKKALNDLIKNKK